HMDGVNRWQPLATFNIIGNQQYFFSPPKILRPDTKINIADAVANKRIIKLMFGHSMPEMPEIQATGNIKFFVKATMKPNPAFDTNQPESPANKKMIMDQPLPFALVTAEIADKVKANETWIIEIVNLTGGDHNFHLHGFMFHLIDTRYEDDETMSYPAAVPASRLEYKDTIMVPKRPGEVPGKSRSIIRLAVTFNSSGRNILASGKVPTATTSGGWVMHCHFLEHADNGMMSFIQVVP
ncbi:MAG: multicopper oxidase domain-containing protein, partial [Thiohalomonadales bacterium]